MGSLKWYIYCEWCNILQHHWQNMETPNTQQNWKIWLGEIINRVNNKHKAIRKKKENKGPRIIPNDESITREIDFGFIRMIYVEEDDSKEKENQVGDGKFKCLKCGYFYNDKQRIISQIFHKHHELDRTTDLICPYCPGTFSSTATLEIHIHTKVCAKRKEPQTTKIWIDIWNEVCEVNKIPHQLQIKLDRRKIRIIPPLLQI